jgi:hypothetical protein
MCLRRAPEKYIAGAALDRAGLDNRLIDGGKVVSRRTSRTLLPLGKPKGLVRQRGLGKF